MLKKTFFAAVVALMAFSQMAKAQTNLQIFYDFGRDRKHVTTTLEGFYGDKWGNTFFFIDYDYNQKNAKDQNVSPNGSYFEIARCLNFWQNTKAKDLSIQVEYNGGLGLYKDDLEDIRGYGINHAALVGLNYCLHTEDYKNIFNLEILYKYIVDDYNKLANSVPLQFTFVWGCDDFCTAPGLRFSGFLDIWGAKQSVYDRKTGTWTDPTKQSFVLISEPQLWYNVGRWFKCPNLNIGTEIEVSYNFTGKGFMCNPCLGIKWCFD